MLSISETVPNLGGPKPSVNGYVIQTSLYGALVSLVAMTKSLSCAMVIFAQPQRLRTDQSRSIGRSEIFVRDHARQQTLSIDHFRIFGF